MDYTFISETTSQNMNTLLHNINNQTFILIIMLAVTMIFLCILSFHILIKIQETKEVILDNQEKAKEITKKATKKK